MVLLNYLELEGFCYLSQQYPKTLAVIFNYVVMKKVINLWTQRLRYDFLNLLLVYDSYCPKRSLVVG